MKSSPFRSAFSGLLLVFCCLTASAQSDEPQNIEQNIEQFFTNFTDRWMAINPNLAVSSAYFSGAQQSELEQHLTPMTREFRLQLHSLAREGLRELSQFEGSELSQRQQLAADMMQAQLESLLSEEPWLDYILFPLDQMLGANAELPQQLTVVSPLNDEEDAQHYLQRLQQVDERMREATAESARRADLGILPPNFILQSTITQLERFISQPAGVNPLVTTLRDGISEMSLSNDSQTAMLSAAEAIVREQVYPAWQQAIDTLQSQLPQATSDAGVWRFDKGDEIYASQLKVYTTTDLSADAIHQIGLDEVARIETEMDRLLRQLDYQDGSIVERLAQLSKDQSWAGSATGQQDMQDFIEHTLSTAQARAPELFDTMPQTPVIARPYPEFLWNDSAASYNPPALDGSRPGIFQYPLRPSYLTEFGLRTLVYHETVPGHHFQIALAGEDAELPRFMQMSAFGYISASVEGWALYAERLASEYGWYDDDPAGRIGQLDAALFRAKRLVVDTGIHAMGWTRQQAIDYGIEPSEIDRYIVWPGQACSYMIGQLKIVELRELARERLGDKFSIKDFHNVVLSTGGVTLTILEQAVLDYITTQSTQ